MFYFPANLKNIKCWRQATSPIELPAEVSEPQTLYCLLGGRGEEVRERLESGRKQIRT